LYTDIKYLLIVHNVTVEEDDEEAELRALKASIAM
jgi:hypothetical protein